MILIEVDLILMTETLKLFAGLVKHNEVLKEPYFLRFPLLNLGLTKIKHIEKALVRSEYGRHLSLVENQSHHGGT